MAQFEEFPEGPKQDKPDISDSTKKREGRAASSWNEQAGRRSESKISTETIRLSDQKLSSSEINERKSVFRPSDGVGHHYGSSLIAEGHYQQWKDNLPEKTKQAIRTGKAEVVVSSFASAPGSDKSNLELTDARAKNVAFRISADFGIPEENIIKFSLGEQPAKERGAAPDKDNRSDRVTLIEVIPIDEPKPTDKKVDVEEGDSAKIADRTLGALPPPLENRWKQHATDSVKAAASTNPLKIIANFGILGFKNWIESNAEARENLKASANFIPAFMGETTRLTTGRAEFEPLNAGSTDAYIGRYLARKQYLNLSDLDRRKLTSIMQNDQQKKEYLGQLEHGLRKRFIHK